MKIFPFPTGNMIHLYYVKFSMELKNAPVSSK